MKYKLLILTILFSLNIYAQKESKDVKEGNKLYLSKKFEEAKKSYEQGIKKNEKSFSANFNLGNALYRQKDYKASEQQFLKSSSYTKDKKNISSAFHNLGNTFMEQKDYAKSIEAYKNALKANPKDDDTRYNLAVAQYLMKQQQDQQNKDKNKDKKDNDKKNDKKDKNKKDDKQDKQDKQQQQQQNKMSKEQAEQILQALEQDEKATQDKRQIKMGQKAKLEKEW